MGQIIAVVSGKGGTGKTSFTTNTALALAHMDQRVLCLDCDITLRNLDLALGLSDAAVMDFYDVVKGRCTLEDAIVRHENANTLYLLAAPLIKGTLDVTDEEMLALAQAIREKFDYCLVDSPAGLGQGYHLATLIADSAVVVTTTDVSALRDAQRTVMDLQHFPAGKLHMVINRVDKKMLKSLHTNLDDAMDTAGLPLLGVVPEDRDLPYCLNRGIPLRMHSYYAAKAYDHIAQRIMGNHVPLMKI